MGEPAVRAAARVRGSPVEQPALPFEGADAGDVLHGLDDAAIGAGRVAHREVADLQELAAELDPELGGALVAGAEGVDDLLHLVHARRRVAYTHLTLPTIYSV